MKLTRDGLANDQLGLYRGVAEGSEPDGGSQRDVDGVARVVGCAAAMRHRTPTRGRLATGALAPPSPGADHQVEL